MRNSVTASITTQQALSKYKIQDSFDKNLFSKWVCVFFLITFIQQAMSHYLYLYKNSEADKTFSNTFLPEMELF